MPAHTIKRRAWTLAEDALLRDLIATKKLSFDQMALQFPGRNAGSLRKRALSHLNLRNDGYVAGQRYSYNQSFFKVPNPINCYVAGYYAADGHVADNPTTRLLAMQLAPLDVEQLHVFKRLFEYTGPIAHDDYEGREIYALRLYAAYELTADLERVFGLTKNKTHRLPAPNLTDPHLQLCYLAGLLDGDGCVHINVNGGLTIRYVSASRVIVDWVCAFVESLNLKTLKRGRTGKVSHLGYANAYLYAINGCKAVDLVRRIQALKQEGVPLLDRKWDNPRINAYINDFETKHNLPLTSPPAKPVPA